MMEMSLIIEPDWIDSVLICYKLFLFSGMTDN